LLGSNVIQEVVHAPRRSMTILKLAVAAPLQARVYELIDPVLGQGAFPCVGVEEGESSNSQRTGRWPLEMRQHFLPAAVFATIYQ
jgi:hypothetical protein